MYNSSLFIIDHISSYLVLCLLENGMLVIIILKCKVSYSRRQVSYLLRHLLTLLADHTRCQHN